MTQINDSVVITEKKPVGRPKILDKIIVIKEKRPVGRPKILDKVIKEKRPVGRPRVDKDIKEKRTPIRIRNRKEYQKKYYQEKTKKNKPEPEPEIIEKKPEIDFIIKEVRNEGDYIYITIEKRT
jgi:hypothetical protein